MPYQILLSRSAEKFLKELPRNIYLKISHDIEKLADNPRPHGCKKLKGNREEWRIRIGDYRIIYNIDDDIVTIEVVRIGHRKDVYE
jgi:mRNA interferase RelE/StbE